MLETIISAGLKCKAKKCKLFLSSIEYLGHIVANGAYSADPEKVSKILQWPVPKTGGEIASFLGLCGYYRELVPKFAEIADPLYRQVHTLELVWTDDLNSAFEQLKRAITSEKIVRIADPQLPFILQTDASSVAIGAVLLQFFADANRELPVAFYSRALSQTERRYSTYEKEMLAVVKATEHFRVYLLGRSYTLRTDHSPIRGLARSKLEIMRVERWAMRLSEFDFQVEIVKGKDNVVADALSRIQWLEGKEAQPESVVDDDEEFCVEYSDSDDPLISSDELVNVELENVTDDSTPGPVAPTLESIREAQASDPEFVVVVSWVRNGELPSKQVQEGLTEFPRACVHSFFQLHVVENVLVIHDDDGSPNQRILVPKSMVTSIIRYFHEGPLSAHDSFQRTYAKIAQQYFWLFMKRDISLYVAVCDVCIKFRRLAREPHGSLNPIHVGFRNEIVALDCVGGGNSLPTTARGNRYFLTMIDLFTKYCVVIPMIDHSAGSVVDAFHSHWVLVFGSPYRVHTDQGLEFEGEFATFCEVWRIARSRTTAYHPQGNGACERVNQSIKHNLRKLINEHDLGSWDRVLPLAAFAYNTVVHTSTGFSPFFLTFGADPRVPSDLLIGPPAEKDMGRQAFSLVKTLSFAFENARNALMANQRRSKDSYDTGVVERIFSPGQKVFLRIKNLFMKKGSKLLSPWSGPFEVIETKGILVKIRDMRVSNGRVEWVHHDRLSNPSIFYERRSRSKDLSVEPPERPKETPSAVDTEVETQSCTHASPIHSDSEDLTPEPSAASHTRTSVNEPPVITRSGRIVRPNHNRDYVYNYADFVGLMSLLPNINIPQGMETATAQMFARVEQDQRVHRVRGLFPSEFAFIHRRTGTHYIYNPELALFIADVPQDDTTLFVYIDMATLEPWEEAGNRVPGPPLSDLQLLLPTDLAGYPATESMNRQTPFYGHSEVWSTIRAWPPGYKVLRSQMARSASGSAFGRPQTHAPSVFRGIGGRSSVAPDDSASQAPPRSLMQMLDNTETGRQLLQQYRRDRAERGQETGITGPSTPGSNKPPELVDPFARPSIPAWPAPMRQPVSQSIVDSVLRQHTADTARAPFSLPPERQGFSAQEEAHRFSLSPTVGRFRAPLPVPPGTIAPWQTSAPAMVAPMATFPTSTTTFPVGPTASLSHTHLCSADGADATATTTVGPYGR